MKNMKKLLQKAMVFTLTAAMLLGTPLTASAAGLVDLYSIGDGTGDYSNDGEQTGTITNTDTNTGFLISQNEARIVGIALDRETVNAEKYEPETLKATIVMDGTITAEYDYYKDPELKTDKIFSKGDDITQHVVNELSKKIKWEVVYTDAEGNVIPESKNLPLPTSKVGLSGSAADRSVVTLNPKEGTAEGQELTVRASIDASYYFTQAKGTQNPKGNKVCWVDDEHFKPDDARKGTFYKADAKVSVKEYTNKLTWSDAAADTDQSKADSEMYVKHTLDLSSKLVRDPKTANDAITWTSSNTKAATVNAEGVVTAKKAGKTDITAVSEHGAVATRSITVSDGTKASKVVITESWSQNSLEIVSGNKTITVETYAKVKAYATGKIATAVAAGDQVSGKQIENPEGKVSNIEIKNGDWYIDADGKVQRLDVTDVITWSSNKPAIADVTPVGEQIGGGTATVTLKGVGKATITAKASNGAKATKVANVVASLKKLEIGGVEPDQKVYSGQSIQLTAIRTPEQNKDAVKWTVTAADGVTKTKEASISSKGVLKIANKVTNDTKIKVTLAHNKKGTEVANATVELTLVQSSIDGITVSEGGTPIANVEVNDRGKLVQTITKTENTSNINVPLFKTYTAKVTGDKLGGNLDQAELLTWKTSSAKVAALSGTGKSVDITAVGPGKATITVSGVRVVNGKASVISTKFTVQVKQPVTSLTMNKPTIALAQKTTSKGIQNQKVSLKVTFGPKKADRSQQKIASWTVRKNGGKEEPIKDTKGNEIKKASVTYTLTAPEAGDVYTITAKSETGAMATSTVTIVVPTTAVRIAESVTKDENEEVTAVTAYNKNARTLNVGQVFKLDSYINIGGKKDADAVWVQAGKEGTNVEGVTYTVNKKGIVTLDSKGRVYGVKKGTVTITAKTPTGKKATLKVTVQ